MEEEEYFFECPHCGATVSVLLDPSIHRQRYVEDCEVCCYPLEISFEIEQDGTVMLFDVQLAD